MILKSNIIVRRARYKDKEIIRDMIRKTDDYHYENSPSFRKEVSKNYAEHRKQSDTLIDRVNVGDFYILEVCGNPVGDYNGLG